MYKQEKLRLKREKRELKAEVKKKKIEARKAKRQAREKNKKIGLSFAKVPRYLSFSVSSSHAWKIPWTEGPGGLQFMGSLGVEHD